MESTSASNGKKKRAPNFSPSEITCFVEILLPKYQSMIECKKSDALTRGEKAEAWCNLAQEFNSISSFCHRTEENLKNLWGELKKKARKSQASQRKGLFGTGGGERDTKGDPTQTDLKVLEIIGPSGVGLINHFDGDGGAELLIPCVSVPGGDVAAVDEAPGYSDTVEISSIEGISVSHHNWAQTVPRHLYTKKPDALRMANSSSPTTTPTPCSSSASSSSSTSGESSKKRTVAEELEWAKAMKRRRPSLPAAPVLDENQAKLVAAKLELTLATKASIEEKKRREEELFLIEKSRKESEAELARLQVLKMKKELGIE